MITGKYTRNFGKNNRFLPEKYYEPQRVDEVLDILQKHNRDKIRVIGSLHSWSDIPSSKHVVINLKNINYVSLNKNESPVYAHIGGGAKLKHVIKKIHPYTLPTHGAVFEQTIAGAIATGTHGSGDSSMSNMIEEITLANYDPGTGKARLLTLREGPMLEAARCNLGCMGVVIEVKIKCIPEYFVRESIRPYNNINDIVKAEKIFPLLQFLYIPYSWKFYVFQRKRSEKPSLLVKRLLYRMIKYVMNDVLLHAIIKFFVNILPRNDLFIHLYKKKIPAMLDTPWIISDKSTSVLTLHHELYRHIEMELFIPADKIKKVVEQVSPIVDYFAGNRNLPREMEDKVKELGLLEELKLLKGSYVHHYPLFFRRILPDNRTLLSMTGKAGKHYYSLSFFTYAKHTSSFFAMANFIAKYFVQLHGVVPHWGKYFPLIYEDIHHLYPQLENFKKICKEVDSNQVFTNEYSQRVLNL